MPGDDLYLWSMAKGPALILALGFTSTCCSAMGPFHLDSLTLAPVEHGTAAMDASGQALEAGQENHRAVAIALAVLLGPFGAHRLYLGTTPKVAIAYGLTFGGFGVVALIDLIHLIAVKDLHRFRDSDRILMWAEAGAPHQGP